MGFDFIACNGGIIIYVVDLCYFLRVGWNNACYSVVDDVLLRSVGLGNTLSKVKLFIQRF